LTGLFSGSPGAALSSVAHLGGMAGGFAYLYGRGTWLVWKRKREAHGASRAQRSKKSHLKLVKSDDENPRTWHWHIRSKGFRTSTMALLHESIADKKFDTRMTERNIQRGGLTSAELEKFLKELPDDSENLDVVTPEDLEHQEKVSRRYWSLVSERYRQTQSLKKVRSADRRAARTFFHWTSIPIEKSKT
jgi:hypothetical protein